MGAVNALLAQDFIEKSSPQVRKAVAKEVFSMVRSVFPAMTDSQIAKDLMNANKVAQLNFIALACDNLYLPPKVSNNVWTRVQNPHRVASEVTDEHIHVAADALKKQDGVNY